MKTTEQLIPSITYRIHQAVIAITQKLPIGTNKRIHDTLLTIIGGHLLESRGAIIPALHAINLDKNAILRTREAIAEGSWSVRGLLKQLWNWVQNLDSWQPLIVAGFKVNAMDTTCIYRPRLQNCLTKHYNSTAGKALPAINFGLLSGVGRMQDQKVTIPKLIIRGDEHALSEEQLMQRLAVQASQILTSTDLIVADRKFPVMVMLEAGLKNVVVRRATNITLRRVFIASEVQKTGRGRPRSKGAIIRPLARVYKGKELPGSEPDCIQTWEQTVGVGHEVLKMEARVWQNVEMIEQKTWSQTQKELNKTQSWVVCVVKHPNYDVPIVILFNVELTGQEASRVMCGRWGVEQLPLVSKQLLGLHRMFVHESEMRFRLPELGFIAGSLLMVGAASCELMSSGWWDTQAKPTAGRARRELSKATQPVRCIFRVKTVRDLSVLDVPDKLREKRSMTKHLPRGYHEAIKLVRSKVHLT